MKRVLQFFILPILALAAMGGGAFYWLNQIWLPGQAANFSLHGTPVRMQDPPAIRFFPLRLELGPFSWDTSMGDVRLSFSAAGARIIAVTGAIIAGDEEIWQVILDSPHITIQQTPPGKQTADIAVPERQAAARSPLHAVRAVTISNGAFAISRPGLDVQGSGWNLSLWNLRLRQEMQLRCAGNILLQNGGMPSFSGHLAITAPLRYYAPNLSFQDASASLTAASGPWAMFSPLKISGNGAINGGAGAFRINSASIQSPLARGEVSGTIQDASFQGNARLSFGKDTQKEPVTLDGNVLLDSGGLRLSDATFAKGTLNAAGSGNVYFAGMGELARIQLLWADGEVKAVLRWNGKSFTLDASGKNIQMGEALDQLGVPGLIGCPAQFAANLNFTGADALAMRRSVQGEGQLHCQGLALEPFGELSLLLPLLGRDLKFPDMIEDISAAFTAKNGVVTFSPVKAQGKGISCQGQAELDLADNTVRGSAGARLLGLSIPISFAGPLDNVDFHIGK